MKADEPGCGYCASILYAHCVVFRDGPGFCDLMDRYWNDSNFGTIDVYEALSQIEDVEQKRRVGAWIDTRKARGEGPVTQEEAYPAIRLTPHVAIHVNPAAVTFQVVPPSPAAQAAQGWLGQGGGG